MQKDEQVEWLEAAIAHLQFLKSALEQVPKVVRALQGILPPEAMPPQPEAAPPDSAPSRLDQDPTGTTSFTVHVPAAGQAAQDTELSWPEALDRILTNPAGAWRTVANIKFELQVQHQAMCSRVRNLDAMVRKTLTRCARARGWTRGPKGWRKPPAVPASSNGEPTEGTAA